VPVVAASPASVNLKPSMGDNADVALSPTAAAVPVEAVDSSQPLAEDEPLEEADVAEEADEALLSPPVVDKKTRTNQAIRSKRRTPPIRCKPTGAGC
jgi:hypothetical protein